MCLLIHQGGGWAASFSDFSLLQLPSSCCWTRGADQIKKKCMKTGTSASPVPNIHAPMVHVWLSAGRADVTLSWEGGLKSVQHFIFVVKELPKSSVLKKRSVPVVITNHCITYCESFSVISHRCVKRMASKDDVLQKGSLEGSINYSVLNLH